MSVLLSLTGLLLLSSFVCTLLSIRNKVPLYVALLLLVIANLLSLVIGRV